VGAVMMFFREKQNNNQTNLAVAMRLHAQKL
jgi:hypothetical protein